MTGHRPNKLWGYDTSKPQYDRLRAAINRAIDELGATTLISGMALGLDQVAAEVAASRDDVKLIAAVPFKGQESNWPASSQRAYRNLIAKADEVVVVSPGAYSPSKMQIRNQWMVDNADVVLALWDGTPGGTGNCVSYAQRQNKPIMRLDPREISAGRDADFVSMQSASAKETPKATSTSAEPITRFRGEYYFLSNMFPERLTVGGITYECAEAAFQAQKVTSDAERMKFSKLNGFDARKLGRQVALRPDWDQVRLDVMREVLRAKFSNPELARQLVATQGTIQENNTWGDTFWGISKGQGQNHLGRMLEELREELKQNVHRPTAAEKPAPSAPDAKAATKTDTTTPAPKPVPAKSPIPVPESFYGQALPDGPVPDDMF